jgi:hypothetical protein
MKFLSTTIHMVFTALLLLVLVPKEWIRSMFHPAPQPVKVRRD